MLNDKIKEFYPGHVTPGFLEWLNNEIGVELERVFDDNTIGGTLVIVKNKELIGLTQSDLVNLIKEEL